MAKILVTGCKGFIGKHLMPALKEHEVIGVDLDGDESVTGPLDGIIHLAAVNRVRDGEADRIKCLQTNIILTAMVLEWKPKWFIYISTCEPPTNVYGYSKRAAEQYVELRQPKHIIFRLTNVVGPGMQEDKLLPRLRRGEIKTLDASVLPFEYIHVDDVVREIKQAITLFDQPAFKPLKMKLSTGIAKTREELERVAASY